ncbi:MAG TPA: prolyl oligopeptidase family serine peptidase [Candidatus Limnocylindria bacterium]|nr:prolyl oligopeptidase family serine peptidase [Candidatus Limnocylindria bacterium]
MGRLAAAPPAARGDASEVLHGERIADPYRWLEGDGAASRAWTDAQNTRTRAALDAVPERAHFAARLRELLGVGLLGVPQPVGDRVFFERRSGAARQAVLLLREAAGERSLIDPNALDAQGLVALDWWYPSPDGRLVAYGLSRGGTELSTLHVLDTATGRDLPDEIRFTQRAKVSWVGNAAFYYTVHPAPGSVSPGDEHYYRKVRLHRLGDDPSRDIDVFGQGYPKETIVGVDADARGRWISLVAYEGWTRNDVFLMDTLRESISPVVVGADGISQPAMAGELLFLRTNVGSPNYRIDVVDPRTQARRTVVPESERPIESFDVTRSHVIVHTLVDVASRLSIWSHAGRWERDIALPPFSALLDKGAAVSPIADPDGDRFGYTVDSFTRPPVAYVADARSGETEVVAALPAPAGFEPDAITVGQETFRSKDGTPVPMFLIHRRDVRPTGDVPTILNGYGGFNISRTPAFSGSAAAWVEAGGLYVVANLRGGAEFGERWHRAGMRANKQNVFDDFAAAGEALVAGGWTSPERLGISGGSNGGLLVGVAMTQRPDLFSAVACAVPLLDMLRYQHFLIARFWINEYGSAEDPEQFRWLRAYSPYHNTRAGTRYPAVLFTTAEGDSRVDPGHARKMTALVQWLQRDDPDAVTLLRVDRDAGHGIGKPLDKQVDDYADQLAFFARYLGLRPGERVGTVAAGR